MSEAPTHSPRTSGQRERAAALASAEMDGLLSPPQAIDLELAFSLPSLPLRARYLIETLFSGQHRSKLSGSSPGFAEYRSYQVGDELRRIDWRLYARSDRLCVKQFEDERQMTLCLVLDLSASLRYASQPTLPSKLDFARTVLAGLNLLARRQRDRIGLALVGHTENPADASLWDYLPPRASHAQHQAVYAKLDAVPAVRESDLGNALERIAALLPSTGMVIVASDFYTDIPHLSTAIQYLTSNAVEFLGIQILDPMEIDFAEAKAGCYVDLEGSGQVAVHPASVRPDYLANLQLFQNELFEAIQAHGGSLLTLRTDENPLPALAAYLAKRTQKTFN